MANDDENDPRSRAYIQKTLATLDAMREAKSNAIRDTTLAHASYGGGLLTGFLRLVTEDEAPPTHWLARAHANEPYQGTRADVYLVRGGEGYNGLSLRVGTLLVMLTERDAYETNPGGSSPAAPQAVLALARGRKAALAGVRLELHPSLPQACDTVALEVVHVMNPGLDGITGKCGRWRCHRGDPQTVMRAQLSAPFLASAADRDRSFTVYFATQELATILHHARLAGVLTFCESLGVATETRRMALQPSQLALAQALRLVAVVAPEGRHACSWEALLKMVHDSRLAGELFATFDPPQGPLIWVLEQARRAGVDPGDLQAALGDLDAAANSKPFGAV